MSMLPADAHRRLERPFLVQWSQTELWPIRGVRVEGDTVIIKTQGGAKGAQWMCRRILLEFEAQQQGKTYQDMLKANPLYMDIPFVLTNK